MTIVGDDLRNVLGQRDEELHVGEGVEKDKQVDKQTSLELIPQKSKKNGKKNDDDDLDFLSADYDNEKTALSNLSRKQFDKWFSKRFPKTAKLNTSPLMELYVETLTRSSKYF